MKDRAGDALSCRNGICFHRGYDRRKGHNSESAYCSVNPFGIVQLMSIALEGAARALNPKRERQTRKAAIGFALLYVAILAGGIAILITVIRDLYFK
jgi:hypothetical protein